MNLINNFPTKLIHLNQLGKKLIPMDKNVDSLEYTDIGYRQRRLAIGEMSQGYTIGGGIQQVKYTENEHETWRRALKKLHQYHRNVMCDIYIENLNELQKTLDFSSNIPKINELSYFLKSKTGFQIKPVPGMIDQRQFLNCLAFKVFCSGQFIRHSECIDFTTEPDIIHEFVGHVPMFADPLIAQFSQKLGLLSLGASDADIKMIGRAYLYTIQLGICIQDNQQKAFGAGIAACTSDLIKIMDNSHSWKQFDPKTDLKNRIDDFQKPFECFYLSESIEEATKTVLQIGNNINKPFRCEYDQTASEIKILMLE